MHDNACFMMLDQPSMIVRLFREVQEAWRELRENPRAYITSALKQDAGGGRRTMLLRFGLAIGVLIYALVFASMLVFWSLAHNRGSSSEHGNPAVVFHLPSYSPKTAAPKGEEGPGGGGGGGGDEQPDPPAQGTPPEFQVTPIVGPTPEPALKPPILPVIEAVKGDSQVQLKRDELGLTGLPEWAVGPPSAGPGREGGIGSGSRGGIGPNNGPGLGPGDDEGGIGDGPFGRGTPRTASQNVMVDTRPVLLNEPRPLYTEEARKNRIQGVVRVRVLIDESGSVKEVVITRGLPDGLSEQAIRAAYQMRFKPAMKKGRAVSYWLSNIEIEFNLR